MASRLSRASSIPAALAPRSARSMSSSWDSGRRRNTCSRDNSWRVTEKDGFSVVVASSTMSPVSSSGRKKSCWALENRCSSSRMRISLPLISSRRAESPASGALTRTYGRPLALARIRAKVDLPQPGGPNSSRLGRRGAASMVVSRDTTWVWPTKSGKPVGRMRSARGRFSLPRRSMRSLSGCWGKGCLRRPKGGALWNPNIVLCCSVRLFSAVRRHPVKGVLFAVPGQGRAVKSRSGPGPTRPARPSPSAGPAGPDSRLRSRRP